MHTVHTMQVVYLRSCLTRTSEWMQCCLAVHAYLQSSFGSGASGGMLGSCSLPTYLYVLCSA